jgi:predicted nucleic acid-binding protein
MDPLFLDTGYLIALEAADDQHHSSAVQHWETLRRSLPPLVTTSYVFDEIVTFFNSRRQHEKAVELGQMLLGSPSVAFVQIDEARFFSAWEYFQQRADKSYSFTDCLSFLVMREKAIAQALTFDGHFVQAGFQKLP